MSAFETVIRDNEVQAWISYSVQRWFTPHPARVNSSNILHSERHVMTVQLHRRIRGKDLFVSQPWSECHILARAGFHTAR